MNPNPYASPQSPPGRAGLREVLHIVVLMANLAFVFYPPLNFFAWLAIERITEPTPEVFWLGLLCGCISTMLTHPVITDIFHRLDRWIDERWAD